MIATIFSALLVIINSAFLIYSLGALGVIFTVYFVITQGILSWFFIDNVLYVSDNNISLAPSERVIVHLPEDKTRTKKEEKEILKNISFNMPEQEIEDRKKDTTLETESIEQKIIFLDKKLSDPQQSQLAMIDNAVRQTNLSKRKLMIANMPMLSEKSKTLCDTFSGEISESEILCRAIAKRTDLIPHIGPVGDIFYFDLQKFIKRHASSYDQIVFYLNSEENAVIKDLLAEEFNESKMAYVPTSLI